jgi:4-aminobutyrate aminotransferase-like enzyme
VLDVLETERLQENARAVGEHLLIGLRRLMEQHEVIGDVRGSGLMLGFEMVENRTSLSPAAKRASYLADRMRDRGILLGTDGIHHNVIKLRGPLCMTLADAEMMLSALDETLREDGAR